MEILKKYFYTEVNVLGNHHYRSVPRYRHVVIHIEDSAETQRNLERLAPASTGPPRSRDLQQPLTNTHLIHIMNVLFRLINFEKRFYFRNISIYLLIYVEMWVL